MINAFLFAFGAVGFLAALAGFVILAFFGIRSVLIGLGFEKETATFITHTIFIIAFTIGVVSTSHDYCVVQAGNSTGIGELMKCHWW